MAAAALAVVIGLCACASADAQQPRTVRDGVYRAEQAAQGAAVYAARCASCHGATLAGDVAPPLAGESFLRVWAGRQLAELAGKIRNTMPADAPGTLSPADVVDVVAYMLQRGGFVAGDRLPDADAALARISFPRAAAAVAGGPGSGEPPFAATGNLNQVMRGTLFPSSNVLFDVQTQDPGARAQGARADAATTTARYGDVYAPWQVVDAAAIAIAESGPLLMAPGRRCENGKPVPVDRADWQAYVRGLVEAGRAAYKASQSRSQQAVSEVTNVVSDACANCHRVYRDVASAALRCTPL